MKYLISFEKLKGILFTMIIALAIILPEENAFAAQGSTNQQKITVSGIVTSANVNQGLPGVSVVIKGTATGTVTNADGRYSISVPSDAILKFSFIGYTAQEIAVNGKTEINAVLEETTSELGTVVITALGIKREEKSLGYSVGKVGGEELTRVVQENVLNSMAGKVTGVQISSTGGAGSSVSMIIRGATSMSTDNQPLFVVDGVPMSSTVNNVGGFGNGNNVDYGNAISDIDPESIESVSILKGPSAAALYGTRAGNGVVLITTKKASAKQAMKIEVVSNTVFDIPSKYLDIQNRFAFGARPYTPDAFADGIIPPFSPSEAAGAGPELNKGYWQVQPFAPLDANGVPIPTELVSYPNNYKNFINSSAFTTNNGISVSGSGDKINYRLGVSNMTNSGLVPNSDLNRNNLSLAVSSKVRDNLTVSSDIAYTRNWSNNRPSTQERGTNPLQAAAYMPPNVDIRQMRDYDLGGGQVKNIGEGWNNPYYLAYGINNSFSRNRLMGNLQATWEITPKISLMGRYSLNKTDEVRETKMDPGYSDEPNNGTYGINSGEGMEQNLDALATYKDKWNDFSLTASLGGNLLYARGSGISASAKSGSGLIVPYVYTVQNIANTSLNYYNSRYEKAINSLYAMANFGYKDLVYLDVTARNDWSSTLP
jgi:TonB-linked SusC/RagA family outer membrane protein